MITGQNEDEHVSLGFEDQAQIDAGTAFIVISSESADCYSGMEMGSAESGGGRLQGARRQFEFGVRASPQRPDE
jgi:hypothetical protein